QQAQKMSIGGYDPRNELHASLIVAFGELKPETAIEYLEQFDTSQRSLSPRLFVRQSEPGRGRMQSRWDVILSSISDNQEMNVRARSALDKVAKAQPNSVTPLILNALLSLAGDEKQAQTAVARLVQFVDKHPLRKADSPAADDQIALWLVARECLTRPSF